MREYAHITITEDRVVTKSRAGTNDDLETDVQYFANDMHLDWIIRSIKGAYRQVVLDDKRSKK